ncbi:MAG: hypothetical protein ACE5LB_06005 [Acidiferrobacterales bacterium]
MAAKKAAKKRVKRAKKAKRVTKRKPVSRKKAASKVKKKVRKKAARKATKKVRKKAAKKVRKKAAKKVARKKKKVTRRAKKAPAKKRGVGAKPARAKANPVTLVTEPTAPEPAPSEERVGVVTHYYTHLGVAVVQLETGVLRDGDTVHIKGHTSDFTQRVESMEIEHMHVGEARAGQSFGLRVREHAREHDVVYRVKPL